MWGRAEVGLILVMPMANGIRRCKIDDFLFNFFFPWYLGIWWVTAGYQGKKKWGILENNLLGWGVFISEMPPEFLEHLHQSTGNWPAQHFRMKQYITVVWKWVQVHQIVATYGAFRWHMKTKSTAASWVFATYCYLLARHTDWPTRGPYTVPQCIMFNIYSLGLGGKIS
jgi:hypothetical protein